MISQSTFPNPTKNTGLWPSIPQKIELSINLPKDISILPKITIITPSLNQGDFIEDTIRSVLLQGYPNLEYWIIDGGSTDNTIETIKKYSPWLAGWVREPDNGQSHAINKGFKRSTGDYLAWLNSDDIYYPGAFFNIANCIQQNPQAVIISGQCMRIDADRNPYEEYHLKEQDFTKESLITSTFVPAQPSVFFSRNALKTIGPLREDLNYALDWEYWIRISLNFNKENFISIPDNIAMFTEWEGSKTVSGKGKDLFEREKILKELFSNLKQSNNLSYLSKHSYANLYLQFGNINLKNLKIFKAIYYYFKAFIKSPKNISPLQIICNIYFSTFPKHVRSKLKNFLGVTEKKQNEHSTKY